MVVVRTLLSLSAELRNIIYTEVLVENEKIRINKNDHQQPGLLQGNRQIRQETRAIYYCQNNFKISCPDFDPTALFAFRRQSKEVAPSMRGFDNKPPEISVKDGRNKHPRCWPNLKKWARAAHEDEALVIHMSDKGDPGRRAAVVVLSIAAETKGLPWERVCKILRIAAKGRDMGWRTKARSARD